MFRPPDPPPMPNRVDADGPITAALLAAVSGQPLAPAESMHAAWLQIARFATADDTIVVFDTFVLGRPDPFLREVADRLRAVRRAEQRGEFDDEPGCFDDDWADDDHVEPPSRADRVIDSLRHCPDWDRLLDEGRFVRMVWALDGADRSNWLRHVRLTLAMERLVLELADAIHIDGAVIIDSRLPGQRVDSLMWAA